LKEVVLEEDTFQEIPGELLVGINIAKDCEYLVSYKKWFYLASSILCIIMEYFKSGDLENYLTLKFKEGYIFSISVFILFKYIYYFVSSGNN
jgi:hypothetical protein